MYYKKPTIIILKHAIYRVLSCRNPVVCKFSALGWGGARGLMTVHLPA